MPFDEDLDCLAPDADKRTQRTGIALAVAACAVTTAVAVPLRGLLAEANLLMMYLLAVLVVTFRCGRTPGIVASVLAVLAFDVFMVPPYFSLTVADPQYLLTLAVMLLVSLLVSYLTASLGRQATIARQREMRTNVLFELSRELSGAASYDDVAAIGVRRISATFRARAAILFPDEHGRLVVATPAGSPRLALPEAALAVANAVYSRQVTVGYDEGATTAAGIQFFPLRAPLRTRGVLVMIPTRLAPSQQPEQLRLLQTSAAQIALAIERVHHGDAARTSMLAIESERLRNSLLSAVSHDIRTPLTGIVGLSSTLAARPAAALEQALAVSIRDAALEMSKLVANLLDMARLHEGAVTLNRQWQTVEEVVGSTLAASAATLAGAEVRVALPPRLPLLEIDTVMVERVLANLLDNAVKYAGPNPALVIAARDLGGLVEVSVEDNGPGIDSHLHAAIFDKFVRGASESARSGVGLGLSICKAIVVAHGGTIRAESLPGGGSRFSFTLPVGAAPCLVDD